MIVDGQIHGGLAEGIGIALMEVITFDDEGNCLNGSFMDYLIPTALECPDFELGETVTPCPHHPLGAKGVGESPNVGLAAGDRQRGDRRAARDARRRPHRHALHPGARVGRDAGAPRAAAVSPEVTGRRGRARHLAPDVETLAQRLAAVDYLVDEGLATAMFLSLRLPQPLLLEGEAGVGKTEAGKALAAVLDTPLIRLQCYDGIDAAEALYEWNYPRQLLSIRLADANRTRAERGRPLRSRLPDPAPAAARARASRAAAGGAADRRDRPRRRRLRGVPARAARRGGRDDPGARHGPRDAPAGDRAHVEPHARPARRGQAPLPVPVDRLPDARSARSRSCAAASRATSESLAVQVVGAVGADARQRRAEAAGDRRGDRLARGARAARRRAARRGRGRPHARLGAQVRRGPGRRPRGRARPARAGAASELRGRDGRARPAGARRRLRPAAARGRRAGDAERSARFAQALALVRPISRRRLYWTARAALVSDPAQVTAFDAVFAAVFGSRVDAAGAAARGRAPRRRRRPTTARPPGRRGARRRARRRRRAAARVGRARRRRRARRRGAGRGQRRGAAARQALRRARARRARRALPAHDAAADRDAGAAHAPRGARPPRRAHRPAPHAARQPAHRRRPDPARAPAPARRPAPARAAVRHLGLDGALRARVPAVPDLRRRQRAGRRGVRVRHAPDARDARARLAQPRARDPARRRRRARLVERDAHRRRAARVQRPPRPPRDGPRRRRRDPLRRLGARRAGRSSAARWSASRGWRYRIVWVNPRVERERLRPARRRHGGGAAARRRARERPQPRRARRGRRRDRRRARRGGLGARAAAARARGRRAVGERHAGRRAARSRCRAATARAAAGRRRGGRR